ncbi:MAG: Ribosomal RNA small subunit methyltransferase E [Chlamydiia bacterium]|nr:Ribosomal RNA small subunit methyltransferase E [Chlamydiia bacterium]
MPRSQVSLSDEEYNHIVRVNRKLVGDQVELINGMGSLAGATISEIGPKSVQLIIDSCSESDPPPPLVLIMGMPKMGKADLIVEKGTELGVSHFFFFHASQSEKKGFSTNQSKRLQRLLISAMKQSGNLFLPKVAEINSLSEIDPTLGPIYFGAISSDRSSLREVNRPAQVVIGPEKGLTQEEESFLKEHLGGVGVGLAPYILRAETAALAAISQISAL